MADKQTPILIMNIQINESEYERLEINTLKDIAEKVENFCRTYQLKDTKVIRSIKKRAEKSLIDKFPFLKHSEDKKRILKASTGSKSNKHKIPNRRLRNSHRSQKRSLMQDTANRPIGISGLIFNKVSNNFIYKRPPLPQTKPKGIASAFIYKKKKTSDKQKNKKQKTVSSKINFDKENKQRDLVTPVKQPSTEQFEEFSIYGRRNRAMESFTYTNPAVMKRQTQSVHIPERREPSAQKLEINLNNEVSTFLTNKSNKDQSRKKSSFYGDCNTPKKQNNKEAGTGIRMRESKLRHEIIRESIHDSVLSYETYVFKILPKDVLRKIFDSMDQNDSGLIGPKNLNLRSISAEHLKLLENVVLEIFSLNKNSFFTFTDFCKLVKKYVEMD